MVDADVESKWYQALNEEDCLGVMSLLKADAYPYLWKQGWKSEPSRKIEESTHYPYSSSRSERQPSSHWKGRTALHVGARRGCAELLNRVLELCNSENASVAREQTGGSVQGVVSPATNSPETPSVEDVHEDIEWPWRNAPENPWVEDVDADIEWAWRLPWYLIDFVQVADGRKKYLSDSFVHLSSDSFSLKDLLLAKDGTYRLDAIAMARVNGNLEIQEILLKAGLECSDVRDKYGIKRLSSFLPTVEREAADRTRQQKQAEITEIKEILAEVTDSVIERFSAADSRLWEVIRNAYNGHRDFNFLPIGEYLFHFLFSDPGTDSENILYGIFLADLGDHVWRSSRTLWCFLWEEFQDGQGRLPLHVAADEGTLSVRFARVFRRCMPGDEPTIKEIINAVDGGRWTAFHRATMRRSARESDIDIWHSHVDDIFYQLDRFNQKRSSDDHNRGWTNSADFMNVLRSLKFIPEIRRNRAESKNKRSSRIVREAIRDSLTEHRHSWVRIDKRSDFWLDEDKLSRYNGFKGRRSSNPNSLQSAIIHNAEMKDFYKAISPWCENFGWNELKLYHEKLFRATFQWFHAPDVIPPSWVTIDCFTLAILVGGSGRDSALQLLTDVEITLEEHATSNSWESSIFDRNLSIWEEMTKLHSAASAGNYETLKRITDHIHCDPFVEDKLGNNALHYATLANGIILYNYHTHLLDYVDCYQILDWHENSSKMYEPSSDSVIERQGCIDLLIQLGCDIFQTNHNGQAPYPGRKMSSNTEFLKWWNEKQAKEFGTLQSTLGVAANAISVVGALIATASYVGPLQPPQGFGEETRELRLENKWVKIFIVCDTLSFYLAIAAIIASLIPSLPLAQQSMMEELRRTRRMVTMATTILFPSILLILVAFASGSFAVAHPHDESWNSGDLTILTACVGGSFCVVIICLFFIRLASILFRKNALMKKIYKATSF